MAQYLGQAMSFAMAMLVGASGYIFVERNTDKIRPMCLIEQGVYDNSVSRTRMPGNY